LHGGLRQQIGPGSRALLFFAHISWALVLPQGYEACMPQVKIAGPFNELELAHDFRLQPPTFLHFCRRQQELLITGQK
jgi:hypothetical protein